MRDKEKQKEYDKVRYQRLKEKRKAEAKKYRKEHPEQCKKYARQYYKENVGVFQRSLIKHKDSARDRVLRKLGWTLVSYKEAEREQKGLCYICNKMWPRALAADHDHDSMEPRKLLCGNCNAALGLLQDSSDLAYKVADYLRKFGK